MTHKNREIKIVFAVLAVVFAVFLALPMIRLLYKSFLGSKGLSLDNYISVFTSRGFGRALGNSFLVSSVSALVTTLLAFFLAYTIHYTNVPGRLKSLLLGYVIYTLPISFMLINNTMGYIDKKFMIVSRIMGDSGLSAFMMTILRPLSGTLAASFIQSFFLSFTDFGIPASVGGKFQVIAAVLYQEMLGSIPNFNNGAVVAMVMLLPSVVSIAVLQYLERYNVRYNKISVIELQKNRVRDWICGTAGTLIAASVLSIFAVIFVVPFLSEWPYDIRPTPKHVTAVFADSALFGVYKNSLMVALITAVAGTLVSYGAALVTARSTVNRRLKNIIESIALITNTIPGMVIGLAFLFSFSGTPVQNTFFIIIVCNVVHFFSTPYLMMKNSLAKMNASWETTAMLMGDNWVKTILRVVTPNAVSTILEVFSYYFVNVMVTISAVIFITGARTMVITTKIKELQYYNKYNEIFVLSLLILFTNLAAKCLFQYLANRKENAVTSKSRRMKIAQ